MSDLSLSPLGASVQGTLSSFINMSLCQPLFSVKSYIMAGKGYPPTTHLYRGYRINVLADISNQGVAFLTYRTYSKYVHHDQPMSSVQEFAGGLVAGAVSAPLQGACERIMIIQQLSSAPLRIIDTASEIESKERGRGFLKALHLTTLRESINATAFFGLSHVFHNQMMKVTDSSYFANVVSYFTAGVCAGAITAPIDLLKTRLQEQVGKSCSTVEMIKQVGYKHLVAGVPARAATIGCTMMTLGILSHEIPKYLPGFLYADSDFSLLPKPPFSGLTPPKP